MPTESWESFRNEELRNPEIASVYLSDVFETGTPREILQAIDRVLSANGAKNGHTGLEELIALRELGLHLNVTSSIALEA